MIISFFRTTSNPPRAFSLGSPARNRCTQSYDDNPHRLQIHEVRRGETERFKIEVENGLGEVNLEMSKGLGQRLDDADVEIPVRRQRWWSHGEAAQCLHFGEDWRDLRL